MSPKIKDSQDEDLNRKVEINRLFEVFQSNRTPFLIQIMLFLISICVTIVLVVYIGKWQIDEYQKFINNKNSTDYEKSISLCDEMNYFNINVFSTSVSFALIVLYIFIYKRRVFQVKTFRYRNIGIPCIVSCWNKSDRLYTSLTYGIIAFNIYGIVKDDLFKSEKNFEKEKFITEADEYGFAALGIRIVQVILIGISKIAL